MERPREDDGGPSLWRRARGPLLALVVGLALIYVAVRLVFDAPESRRTEPAGERHAESDAQRRRLFAERAASVVRPPVTDRACPVQPRQPRPLGHALPLTDEETPFHLQLRRYARRAGYPADVLPLDPGGAGPIRTPESWREEPAWTAGDHQLVLLVEQWRDPQVGSGPMARIEPGRLVGRLLVWSFPEDRVVCRADVDERNARDVTVVSRQDPVGRDVADDPLAKVRLDLVLEAFRQGVEALTATESPPDPETR